MIIWLASYPKSGNTWLRSFLSTALYDKDGKSEFKHLRKIKQFPVSSQFKELISDYGNINEIARAWLKAQQSINLDGKIRLFKTHHVNCKIGNSIFTDNSNTLGVIHIVRDPRNVVTSIKNHYSLPDINEAKNFLFDENMWIKKPKNHSGNEDDLIIPTLISSWKTNYFSWKNKSKNYLLIRYEDLLNKPHESFFQIAEYISKLMDIKIDNELVKKAIDSNSFEVLQKFEERGMFKEYKNRPQNENTFKFFNLGPKNKWENILDPSIAEQITDKFYKEMKELNYI